MISAIITSYKEPTTIKKAIESLAEQLTKSDEIIVTAPDAETRKAAQSSKTKGVPLKIIKDKGKGKPAALNYATRVARNEFLVLTDGDVKVASGSISALRKRIEPTIGIVTGRVISVSPKDTMLGFWAYVLTESFHTLRTSSPALATGYLYLIRKSLMPQLPEDTLADDAYISFSLSEKGYSTIYEPKAKVYVTYPSTLPDWFRQKKRTAGRIYQLDKRFNRSKFSGLFQEIRQGIASVRLARSPKELFWIFALWEIKLYLWARVLCDYRLRKRSFKEVWMRVETTK